MFYAIAEIGIYQWVGMIRKISISHTRMDSKSVDDEYHLLTVSPAFQNVRAKYLSNTWLI